METKQLSLSSGAKISVNVEKVADRNWSANTSYDNREFRVAGKLTAAFAEKALIKEVGKYVAEQWAREKEMEKLKAWNEGKPRVV